MPFNTGEYEAHLVARYAGGCDSSFPTKRFETQAAAEAWLRTYVGTRNKARGILGYYGQVYRGDVEIADIQPPVRRAPPAPAKRKVKAPPKRLDAPPGMFCPAKLLERAGTPSQRTYCGPWALMAITGKPFVEIRAAINRVRGKAPNAAVKGVYGREMVAVLRGMKRMAETQPWALHKDKTLAALLRDRTPEQQAQTWLIIAANHYVLVRGKKATCAMLKCWTWIGSAKKRRGEVKSVIRVG